MYSGSEFESDVWLGSGQVCLMPTITTRDEPAEPGAPAMGAMALCIPLMQPKA